MHKIGLFPGTFDPVTLGHIDIIDRAIPLFHKLYIGIGNNSNKKTMFSAKKRKQWFDKIYSQNPNIETIIYNGLTIDCCHQLNAKFIIRGIRYVSDFEYEKAIADANRQLDKKIETIFLTCEPKFSSVASTIVRDIIRNGGDVSNFLPDIVNNDLK
ncbi:MAG: pantetheine-phosphate adenylyltransferase [Sediminibacterium sp.]|nr:pantetheine-phosphate adenylyltransferase [Sediminibacterium sp.]